MSNFQGQEGTQRPDQCWELVADDVVIELVKVLG
jgi:hypothetical protein